jgi:predicted short-subunit dehydrogenase-like oxidoreductase (DUF2520 family)
MSEICNSYMIIGDGRVARHFAHYLSILGLRFRRWARRTSPDADLQQLIAESTHVAILISDSAIEDFIQDHPSLSGKTLIHFSGCLVTPLAYGAHPLMTFTEKLYSRDRYLKIPFVLDRGRLTFQDLLPGLENSHFYIDPKLRPLYHALCVASGNFTTILWDQFFSTLNGKLGLPKEVAYPYLQQVSQNLRDSSVPPLTGPLARRDLETIVANLRALEGDPLQKIYCGFLEAMNLNIREIS